MSEINLFKKETFSFLNKFISYNKSQMKRVLNVNEAMKHSQTNAVFRTKKLVENLVLKQWVPVTFSPSPLLSC